MPCKMCGTPMTCHCINSWNYRNLSHGCSFFNDFLFQSEIIESVDFMIEGVLCHGDGIENPILLFDYGRCGQ